MPVHSPDLRACPRALGREALIPLLPHAPGSRDGQEVEGPGNLCPFTWSAPGLPERPGWRGGGRGTSAHMGTWGGKKFPYLGRSGIHPSSRWSILCPVFFLKLFYLFSLWNYFRANPSLPALSPPSMAVRGIWCHRSAIGTFLPESRCAGRGREGRAGDMTSGLGLGKEEKESRSCRV